MEGREIQRLINELKALHIKEAEVLHQLEAAASDRSRRDQKGEGRDRNQEKGTFVTGQRVYITNNIRRPINCPAHWQIQKERFATVIKQANNKVFIRTDNGVETWRAPKNLTKIEDDRTSS